MSSPSPFDEEDEAVHGKPVPASTAAPSKSMDTTPKGIHGVRAPRSDDGSLPDRWKDEEWKRKQKTRLEKEMDVELQRLRADTAIEREDAYDNLCNSKDRTQTTAIIAIFILEVGIMKDLVVYNRTDGIFFYVVLGFLLLAILVTIIAGFLIIYVYNIKSKIKKMGSSMVDATVGYGTFTISKSHKLFTGEEIKVDREPLVMDDADEASGIKGYFRQFFTTKEESLEDRLLRMYKKCYIHELQATLDFAHAQADAGKLDRDLVAAAEAGDFYQDPNAFPQEFLDDDQSLSDAKLRKLMDNWHHLKSLRKQGSTLLQRAMEISRRKMFGKLLYIQNWVTHLLFALCLIAIVTIAFGLTLSYEDLYSNN